MEDSDSQNSQLVDSTPKRLKTRKKRSFVWTHFDQIEVTASGRKAKCNECDEIIEISVDASTAKLISHLTTQHKIYDPTETKVKKRRGTDSSITLADQNKLDSLLYVHSQIVLS